MFNHVSDALLYTNKVLLSVIPIHRFVRVVKMMVSLWQQELTSLWA